jgi:hypothetical protein
MGARDKAITRRDPSGTRDRKLMIAEDQNDRWEWIGTLERFQ